MLPNYKPLEYAELPDDFDENKQIIEKYLPSDEGDYIYLGLELKELILTDEEIENLPY